MKKTGVVVYTILIAVLLMGVSSVLANPVLELPMQELTVEELGEIVPWYDTEAKPLDSMVLQEIALRELDESWLFITLTYRDEEDGATLDALLFGQKEQLLVDHASLRGTVDLSLHRYAGFILEPAIYFPESQVMLGIVGDITRSYGRQFLKSTVLR